MKIAHINVDYRSNGGIGAYLLGICRVQVEDGHEVVVIHNNPEPNKDCLQVEDFYVEGFTDFKNAQQEEKTEEVLRILKEKNPDVVHVHSNDNYGLEAKIRERYPVLKTIHVYEFCPAGTKFHYASKTPCTYKTSWKCAPRMVYKRCTLSKRPNVLGDFYRRSRQQIKNDGQHHKIVVASRYVYERALETGYRPEQVEILPYFTADPKVTSDHKDEKEKTILFVGRAVLEKGLDHLIASLQHISQDFSWKLVVNGDGAELSKIKKIVNQMGLGERVSFHGWAGPVEHRLMYEHASVVVVPSIWPEPFGLVGIEAMSYSKPVVAFRVGGIPDWLEDGKSGYLIEPYDQKQMAQKVESLLRDDVGRMKMGQQGRENFEKKFTAQVHKKRLFELYDEVMSGYRKG